MPSTGTILIVDDSPDDVQLLLRTFGQVGVDNLVQTCMNADEAIAFLETHNLPVLILLDLKMPLKDGFYVLNRIRSHPRWKEIIVIVLSTSSDLHDIRLAYEMGANSFLTKPFDLAEFRELVSAFYKYWIVRNQPAPPRGRIIPMPVDTPDVNKAS